MPVAESAGYIYNGTPPNSLVAAYFANNFDRAAAYRAVRHLHINSTLRKDEWERLDAMVVHAYHQKLVGVQHLRDEPGLLQPESVAVAIAQYNKMSSMGPANTSMNPLADGNRGRADYTLAGVPVPFAFQDFQLDIRTLTASRQPGRGLDLDQGMESTYQVALIWETFLFQGTPAIASKDSQGNLQTIYGYTSHTSRNTGTATGDWGDATSGYLYIFQTVEAMKLSLRDDGYYGPYWLYINSHNWKDINTPNTYGLKPIDALRNDPDLAKVEFTPQLDSGELVMVDPKPDVVKWVEEMPIMPVEWDEKGVLGTNYRVIGCATPLVKARSGGQCGVAHYTQAT